MLVAASRMMRTDVTRPHGAKARYSCSSSALKGRLPTNTDLVVSGVRGVPALSTRKCLPLNSVPPSARAAFAASFVSYTTYAFMLSLSGCSLPPRRPALRLALLPGISSATDRNRTLSTAPNCDTSFLKGFGCFAVSTGKFPTNNVRASRSGSSSFESLCSFWASALAGAPSPPALAAPFSVVAAATVFAVAFFAFFLLFPVRAAMSPNSSASSSASSCRRSLPGFRVRGCMSASPSASPPNSPPRDRFVCFTSRSMSSPSAFRFDPCVSRFDMPVSTSSSSVSSSLGSNSSRDDFCGRARRCTTTARWTAISFGLASTNTAPSPASSTSAAGDAFFPFPFPSVPALAKIDEKMDPAT
eukprot:Opistho-1_new@64506